MAKIAYWKCFFDMAPRTFFGKSSTMRRRRGVLQSFSCVISMTTIFKRQLGSYFLYIFSAKIQLKITAKSLIQHCERSELHLHQFKMPKIVQFGEFFKPWSLRLNSVTRQVNFNWKKWWKILKMSHLKFVKFGIFYQFLFF